VEKVLERKEMVQNQNPSNSLRNRSPAFEMKDFVLVVVGEVVLEEEEWRESRILALMTAPWIVVVRLDVVVIEWTIVWDREWTTEWEIEEEKIADMMREESTGTMMREWIVEMTMIDAATSEGRTPTIDGTIVGTNGTMIVTRETIGAVEEMMIAGEMNEILVEGMIVTIEEMIEGMTEGMTGEATVEMIVGIGIVFSYRRY
jgi:hypothetical protein